LATAVTAIIARRVGEKKMEDAGTSAVQSIFLSVLCSIPFAIAGIFFAKDLLTIMGADAWSIEHGYRFTQWMLGGNIVIVLLFVINAIFRGAGDAGIATTTGRGIGVLIQLWTLFHGGKHIQVKLSQLYWDAKIMLNIVRTSIGGVGQMIVAMTSWIFLMRILASVGSEAVAGATITIRIMMFTLMPAWGLSNAAATLVGQNLGAGHPARAESAVWKTGMYNMIFL